MSDFVSAIIVALAAAAIVIVFQKERLHRHRSSNPISRPRKTMAPIVHFVRHAQGYHNLNVANHQIRDPLLTGHGEQQCAHLSRTFPYIAYVDLVVASPLKRTIHTALNSFSDVIEQRKLQVICLPELQETSDLPCDTGSSMEELRREFAGKPVSFDLIKNQPDWYSKKGKWSPQAPAIEQRCLVARRWLRDRPEKHIVAVTHGGLLHFLTEDWQGMDRLQSTGWANTEFRSYTFDPRRFESASVVETEESRLRRRGTEKPLSESEQRNLSRSTGKDVRSGGVSQSQESGKIAAKV